MAENELALRGASIDTDVTLEAVIGHAVMWTILILITVGFAAMFFPYSLGKYILNKTYIVKDGKRIARLRCDLNIYDQIGHAVLWFVLSIITLGIGLVLYAYKSIAYILDHTVLEPI